MTHFMEEKLQMLEGYINKLDTAVSENDIAKARALQREVIAVYDPEIESLRGGWIVKVFPTPLKTRHLLITSGMPGCYG